MRVPYKNTCADCETGFELFSSCWPLSRGLHPKMLTKRLAALVFLLVFASAQTEDDLTYDDQEYWPPKKQQSSVLADIAREVFRRSTSTSQILNLNLSSLLLLLILKAFVYGAGFFGHHAPGIKARNEPDAEVNKVITEGEVALAMGYLIGDTCLYRAACEVPQTATEYLGAAEMLLRTLQLFPQSKTPESYEKTMSEVRKAIDMGSKGQCPPEYSCKKENIHKFLRPE